MTPGVFDPDEDYNEAMSYTDPRGECKFKHYAQHTDQYEVEVRECHNYWWVAPIVFWGAAVIFLLLSKTG